jgi:predicted nucleotidyltransferase
VIEIEAAQKQKLDSIRKKYGIRLILAFGSQIRGIVHQESDLDLGVLYEGEQKPLDVAAELQKVFPHHELDLVNLAITEQTLSAPIDYHSSFTQLEKLNIPKNEDAARFAKLVGLRNRLSLEYNGIDEKLIHQAVTEIVAELPTYIEGIRKFVSVST